MSNNDHTIIQRITDLEDEFENYLAEQRRKFGYSLNKGRAVFEEATRKRHLKLRKTVQASLEDARIRNLIAAPFIYSVVFPIALLDIFVSLYQAICFRLWNIRRVKRAMFVVIDRHRLPYLNLIQKLNCVYCGYANGVLAYSGEIASRTEQYWCPIKHSLRIKHPHKRYYDFLEFGDGEELEQRVKDIRGAIRSEKVRETANSRCRTCRNEDGDEARESKDPVE